MRIPTLLMSGTLPEFFIKIKVNKNFKGIFGRRGLLFEPFKLKPILKPILLHNKVNEKVVDEIIENYHSKLVSL